jgi:photosystem II stability/assembly factor-like uncharacterized protein
MPQDLAVSAGTAPAIYVSSGDGVLAPILGRPSIWKSADGGVEWHIVDEPPESFGRCCALIADPADPDSVYAIVLGVGIGGGGSVARRTFDGGRTWTALPFEGLLLTLSALPTSPTTLLAQGYDFDTDAAFALRRSTDRGETWTRVGAGLPDVEITNIVSDPRQPERVFAGTAGRGVFRSLDAGATWVPTGH